MLEVRQYRGADIPAVTGLVRQNLGVQGYDQRYFGWKFSHRAGERRPLGFVADEDGRVLGFASFFPYAAQLQGRPGYIYLIADCVIEPGHRGRGHFGKLFDHALKTVEAEPDCGGTYLFSSADSDAIYKKRYGYRPIGRPEYRVALGDWQAPLARKLGMKARVEGNGTAPESRVGGLVLSEEKDFDPTVDRLWEKANGQWNVSIVRDSEYLKWRFLRHPWHAYRLLTCRDRGGGLRGYLVMLVDSVHDFVFDGEESGAALLGYARKACMQSGVPVVNCLSLGSEDEKKTLARAGFARYHLPFRPFGLYTRPKPLVRPSPSFSGSGAMLDSDNWKFTFSDVDCGV